MNDSDLHVPRAVVLASRVPHSLYAARAIAQVARSFRYWSPALFSATSSSLWLGVARRRIYEHADGLPRRWLWLSDVIGMLAQGIRLPGTAVHWARCLSLDAQVTMRLTLSFLRVRGGVFHWNNNCLFLAPTLARALGMYLLLDYRALHPNVEHDRPAPMHAVDLREVRIADHILVNSEQARSSFLAQGVEPERLSVVQLGYDASRWNHPRDVVRRRCSVLFVGVVARRKGLLELAEAAKSLPENLAWTFVGPIVEPDVQADLLAALPAARFTGQLTHAELQYEYQRADFLVLPSPKEAFGLVVLEALASGCRALVSNGCGAADVVRSDARLGRVFRAGDVQALAACITEEVRAPDRPDVPDLTESVWTWSGYERRLADWYLSRFRVSATSGRQ